MLQRKTTLERRVLSHGRMGFHVRTSEKRRQIFWLDQLAVFQKVELTREKYFMKGLLH